jgi:hypothetical protein
MKVFLEAKTKRKQKKNKNKNKERRNHKARPRAPRNSHKQAEVSSGTREFLTQT